MHTERLQPLYEFPFTAAAQSAALVPVSPSRQHPPPQGQFSALQPVQSEAEQVTVLLGLINGVGPVAEPPFAEVAGLYLDTHIE